MGQWIVAKIEGFESEEQARNAGRQLGDALLIAGAAAKLGIDVGLDRSTIRFSDEVHDAVRTESGRELRPEVHGLMVYEKDTVTIVGIDAQGSSTIKTQALEERLSEWIHCAGTLTERQRRGAALINDSIFVSQPESRFILLISAVEALCDQAVRETEYRDAIEALEMRLAELTLDKMIRGAIKQTLANAKRESLRQSYMMKFRALRSAGDAKAFDELYGLRSNFVHDGVGRGALNEAADKALQLAVDLLVAELRNS